MSCTCQKCWSSQWKIRNTATSSAEWTEKQSRLYSFHPTQTHTGSPVWAVGGYINGVRYWQLHYITNECKLHREGHPTVWRGNCRWSACLRKTLIWIYTYKLLSFQVLSKNHQGQFCDRYYFNTYEGGLFRNWGIQLFSKKHHNAPFVLLDFQNFPGGMPRPPPTDITMPGSRHENVQYHVSILKRCIMQISRYGRATSRYNQSLSCWSSAQWMQLFRSRV